MGIENRDYMQTDGHGGYTRSSGTTRNVLTTIIVINVIVFVLQLVTERNVSFEDFSQPYLTEYTEDDLRANYNQLIQAGALRSSIVEQWCLLDIEKVLYGQVWRLFTYAFLHSQQSVTHILFNMLILYMAGRKLQSRIGMKEFLWFYVTACVLSGVMFCVWGLINQQMNPSLGASGAVSAVMITYALFWPQDRWLLMMIFPVPVILIVLIYAAMDIYPMLRQLAGNVPTDNIGHSAHVGGLLFGYLYYRNQWTVSNWFQWVDNIRVGNPFKRKPKLRVHRPVEEPVYQKEKPSIPPDVEARVDELLAKISADGEASLSNEEREFLSEASRTYRSR